VNVPRGASRDLALVRPERLEVVEGLASERRREAAPDDLGVDERAVVQVDVGEDAAVAVVRPALVFDTVSA
jgi:hypothetical protein